MIKKEETYCTDCAYGHFGQKGESGCCHQYPPLFSKGSNRMEYLTLKPVKNWCGEYYAK